MEGPPPVGAPRASVVQSVVPLRPRQVAAISSSLGELDDGRAGIGGFVVDQEGVFVSDSGGEDDVGDQTLAFEIGGRLEDRNREFAGESWPGFGIQEARRRW